MVPHNKRDMDCPELPKECEVWKLTDAKGRSGTRTAGAKKMQWRLGKRKSIGKELLRDYPPLCTEFVLHAYHDPFVALALDYKHGNFTGGAGLGRDYLLWRCLAKVVSWDGNKLGCHWIEPHEVFTREQAEQRWRVSSYDRSKLAELLQIYDPGNYPDMYGKLIVGKVKRNSYGSIVRGDCVAFDEFLLMASMKLY